MPEAPRRVQFDPQRPNDARASTHCVVLLNGDALRWVVAADVDAGMVKVVDVDDYGRPIKQGGTRFQTSIRRGVVRILVRQRPANDRRRVAITATTVSVNGGSQKFTASVLPLLNLRDAQLMAGPGGRDPHLCAQVIGVNGMWFRLRPMPIGWVFVRAGAEWMIERQDDA